MTIITPKTEHQNSTEAFMGLFDGIHTPRWYEPGSYLIDAVRAGGKAASGIGAGLGAAVGGRMGSGVKDESGRELSSREHANWQKQQDFDREAAWEKHTKEFGDAPDPKAQWDVLRKNSKLLRDPRFRDAFLAQGKIVAEQHELEKKGRAYRIKMEKEDDDLDLAENFGWDGKPETRQTALNGKNLRDAELIAGPEVWRRLTEGGRTLDLPLFSNGKLDKERFDRLIHPEGPPAPPGTVLSRKTIKDKEGGTTTTFERPDNKPKPRQLSATERLKMNQAWKDIQDAKSLDSPTVHQQKLKIFEKEWGEQSSGSSSGGGAQLKWDPTTHSYVK